jgi:choline-glycine betaine transporter
MSRQAGTVIWVDTDQSGSAAGIAQSEAPFDVEAHRRWLRWFWVLLVFAYGCVAIWLGGRISEINRDAADWRETTPVSTIK